MTNGDKVVCVDDDWSKCWTDPARFFSSLPKSGLVYVIECWDVAKNGERMVQLVGIASPPPGAGLLPVAFQTLSRNQKTK